MPILELSKHFAEKRKIVESLPQLFPPSPSRNEFIGQTNTSENNKHTDIPSKHSTPFSKRNKSYTTAGTGRWNTCITWLFWETLFHIHWLYL